MKQKHIDFIKTGEKILVGIALVMPFVSFAVPLPNCGQLNGVSCNQGGLSDLLITIINIALGISALIAVAFIIYGGFRYVTSAGNEEAAGAGKKTVLNALIGLVIIILAYVIVSVVNKAVVSGTQGGPV